MGEGEKYLEHNSHWQKAELKLLCLLLVLILVYSFLNDYKQLCFFNLPFLTK